MTKKIITFVIGLTVVVMAADPQLTNIFVHSSDYNIIDLDDFRYLGNCSYTDSAVVYDSLVDATGTAFYVHYSPTSTDSFILVDKDTLVGRWQHTDSLYSDSSISIKWNGSVTYDAIDSDLDSMGIWAYIIIDNSDTILVDSLWGDYTVFTGTNKKLNFNFTYNHINWIGNCDAKIMLVADDINKKYPTDMFYSQFSNGRPNDTVLLIMDSIHCLYGSTDSQFFDPGLSGAFQYSNSDSILYVLPSVLTEPYNCAIKIISISGMSFYDTAITTPLYSVIYNGNGNTSGNIPVDDHNYSDGQTVTVLGNIGNIAKTYRIFVSWNTEADGNGTTYLTGETFTIGTSDVTLYAVWNVIGATGQGGGLIFYDKGSYSDGWRYLEAAASDQGSAAGWGCDGTPITGADSTEIGTGSQNTIDIITGCAETNKAAYICANLNLNGYADWFLPSKDELNLMYQNLHLNGLGGFRNYISSSSYWCSSEFDSTRASLQTFYTGNQSTIRKMYGYSVRAARAF